MSHLFISHIEEDNALARELATGLEADGYSTWHYQRDTVPGAPYLLQVGKAIEECGAVVLIVSPKSLESNQVTSEVVRAFECGKHFIPVLCGITDSEFKERQPLWRQALAASTSVVIPPQGTSAVISRIIDGLKALGLQPEGAVSTPTTHTPKHLAQKILAARKGMEGERKQVTAMFADVCGFTSISEEMDPEEVHSLMSECLVFLTEEVDRYEGTVAQFLGDGVLALFGAPIAHEDAPQRALHAALGIRERLKAYALKLKPRGIEFNMRLGLNTGLVIVGKIGDDLTMEYTAMGDTVNLASRMQSLAQPGTILVSESTHRLTEGYFGFRSLGEVEVKGKKQPVKAYELLGPGKAKTRLGVSVARGLTPFVGRKKELGHLMDCYQQAKNGQGQVVGIVGEAGVGKSRLLLQLQETLPQEEHTYVEGGCFHYGDAVPYLPLLNILRCYFGIDEGEPEPSVKRKMREKIGELNQRLEAILPPLHDIFSLKVEDEQYLKLAPPQRREKTFEAIRNLLLRQGHDRPLVLAIEDLHWMDKTSEEFLGQFITSLAHSHILLIVLYRPEYSNPWTSKTYYTQIRVDELSEETSAEMVQAMLHEGKAAPELRGLILSRAAGNPLFMEELTRSLLDRGFIQRQNGSYVLTAKASDIQVPETVQAIIGARIDRLDEGLKRTMQVASAIGRIFSYPLLQGVLGPQEDIKSHLADLQAGEFVYEERLLPELEYIFKHALTQEVAYNSLLIKRRKEIHRRIGKAIEDIYADRLWEFYEMLAYHYSRGEDLEKAYEYLRLSGDKASLRYSHSEAFRFYKEAINVLQELPEGDENKRRGIGVRLAMYMPMRSSGYPEDSLQMLQEGERLAIELNDQRSLAILYSMLSLYHIQTGGGQGIEYGAKAFEAADQIQDLELMATTGFDLCIAYQMTADALKIIAIAPRIIKLFEQTQKEAESFGKGWNLYSALLAVYGYAMGATGRFEEGEALLRKALDFALEINDLLSASLVELEFSALHMIKGDAQETIEHAAKGTDYANRVQVLPFISTGLLIGGFGHFYQGDRETARAHLEKALVIQRDAAMSQHLSLIYVGLAMVQGDSGQPEEARLSIEQALALSQDNNERSNEILARLQFGKILGESDFGQCERAEEQILLGMEIASQLALRPMSAIGYGALGKLYAQTGEHKKALENLQKAQAMFQEMGMNYYWLARADKALEKLKTE